MIGGGVYNDRFDNWNILGFKELVELAISDDSFCKTYITKKQITEESSFYEATTIKSVPIIVAVYYHLNEIRLYTHHLMYELNLINTNCQGIDVKDHVLRILELTRTELPTSILKATDRNSEFPDLFKDSYWVEALGDAYYSSEEFSHKINNYNLSLFEKFSNYQLSLIAKYDSLRIHLLKFVSLLPSLNFDSAHLVIVKNLKESLQNCIQDDELPNYIKFAFRALNYTLSVVPTKLSSCLIKFFIRKMATRFVIDETNSEKYLMNIFQTNRSVTLDRLGELVLSENEADKYCEDVIRVIENLSSKIPSGSKNGCGILNSHVSIKVSALCSNFKPEAFDYTYEKVSQRLKRIIDKAIKTQTFINIDAEHYEYRDCVFAILKRILEDYPKWEDIGIVVQCYLKDSYKHLVDIRNFAKQRKITMPIRFVKGAYWDSETITAKATGHKSFQFLNKEETDICFRQCIGFAYDNYRDIQICVGSHNFIDHIFVENMWKFARTHAPRPEHQCLHKTHEALSRTMVNEGWVVREYLPVGDLLDGMAYLVRRIMENSSQKGVLNIMRSDEMNKLKEISTDRHLSKLLKEEIIFDDTLNFSDNFRNAPPIRMYLENESNEVKKSISEYAIQSVKQSTNLNLDELTESQKLWSSSCHGKRSAILFIVAYKLLIRRIEFAIYIAKETNKSITESLHDVDEAIDFLNFYAKTAMDVELNGRGAMLVISPWNFPLAIPCGMCCASLVAGNVTYLKSSSKSHFVASKFVELMHECGIPTSALIHVVGGYELTDNLLNDDRITGCVFTGSVEVGSNLIKTISNKICKTEQGIYQKKIIAETGGKNSIVITETADMDDAVKGVIQSAFKHAGQKCSACSRIFIHKNIKNKFVTRLIDATDSLVVGDALDFKTDINPVIDEQEANRIKEVQLTLSNIPSQDGCVHFERYDTNVNPMIVELNRACAYKGLHYFNEELFAPIVHIVEYENLNNISEILNNQATKFALTGGVFSQSENEINDILDILDCGNVYINRNITGARVSLEPFGGYYASGTGPKAGSNCYVDAFCINNDYRGVSYSEVEELNKIPGQTNYTEYKKPKRICLVANEQPNQKILAITDELFVNEIPFDIICWNDKYFDKISHHMIINNDGETYIDFDKNYDVYIIADEVDEKTLSKISENFSFNDSLPVVVSKYDNFNKLMFNNIFFNARTIVRNTMKHGAELV